MATVDFPFKIVVSNFGTDEQFPFDVAMKWFKKFRFKSEKVTTPWKVRGIIKFYDHEHGYLDHGDFNEVPLTAQFIGAWWFPRAWKRLELTGTLKNIGRYCFTGWGNCYMHIYDTQNNEVMQLFARVETEIV